MEFYSDTTIDNSVVNCVVNSYRHDKETENRVGHSYSMTSLIEAIKNKDYIEAEQCLNYNNNSHCNSYSNCNQNSYCNSDYSSYDNNNESNSYNDTKYKLMFKAVETGDLDTVKFFLRNNIPITITNMFGQTLIIIATCCNKAEIVRYLLSYYENSKSNYGVSTGNSYGHSHNDSHSHSNSYDNSNSYDDSYSYDGSNSNSHSHSYGNDSHDSFLNLRDNNGMTAFLHAAKRGNTEIVVELLRHDVDINSTDKNKYSALIWASIQGHVSIVTLLLSYHGSSYGNNDSRSNSYSYDSSGTNSGSNSYGNSHSNSNSNSHSNSYSNSYENRIIDTNIRDNHGYSAFLRAVKGGKRDIVTLFLNYGVDLLDNSNEDGYTALMLACRYNYVDIVNLLLGNNFGHGTTLLYSNSHVNSDSVGNSYSNSHRHSYDNNTIQKMISMKSHDDSDAFLIAVRRGHDNLLPLLLSYGADVNSVDNCGQNALMTASQYGHDKVIVFLLRQNVSINMTSLNGQTALMYACGSGYFEIVVLLHKSHALINNIDDKGYNALCYASEMNDTDTINYLIDNGADIDYYNNININSNSSCNDQSSLDNSSNRDNISVFANITDNVNTTNSNNNKNSNFNTKDNSNAISTDNSNSNTSTDNDNSSIKTIRMTALMWACKYGNDVIVTKLLQLGANTTITNLDGENALLLAAKNGHTNCLKLLVDSGCNVNERCKNDAQSDYTALLWACKLGHYEAVKYLICAGADINSTSKGGFTPLIWGIMSGNLEIVNYLLSKKINLHQKDNNGYSAVMWASEHNNIEMVKLLVKAGCDVNSKNFLGETALTWAVRDHNISTINILIKLGANISIKALKGSTLLMTIILHSDAIKTIQCLLYHGIDINAQDNSGETALYKAIAYNGPIENIKILLDNNANTKIGAVGWVTPLLIAAEVDRFDVVELLLGCKSCSDYDSDDNINNATINDNSNSSASSTNSSSNSANSYINSCNRSSSRHNISHIDEADRTGMTALMKAIQNDNYDKVLKLLHFGANVKCQESLNGHSALFLATVNKSTVLCDLLLQHGCRVTDRSKNGNTLLMCSIENNSISMINYFLSKNININDKNYDNKTALYYTIKCYPKALAFNNCYQIVELLLQNDADIDIVNKELVSPLMLSVEIPEVLKLLLENGATINLHDKNGGTILHKIVKDYDFPTIRNSKNYRKVVYRNVIKNPYNRNISIPNSQSNSSTITHNIGDIDWFNNNSYSDINNYIERAALRRHHSHVDHGNSGTMSHASANVYSTDKDDHSDDDYEYFQAVRRSAFIRYSSTNIGISSNSANFNQSHSFGDSLSNSLIDSLGRSAGRNTQLPLEYQLHDDFLANYLSAFPDDFQISLELGIYNDEIGDSQHIQSYQNSLVDGLSHSYSDSQRGGNRRKRNDSSDSEAVNYSSINTDMPFSSAHIHNKVKLVKDETSDWNAKLDGNSSDDDRFVFISERLPSISCYPHYQKNINRNSNIYEKESSSDLDLDSGESFDNNNYSNEHMQSIGHLTMIEKLRRYSLNPTEHSHFVQRYQRMLDSKRRRTMLPIFPPNCFGKSSSNSLGNDTDNSNNTNHSNNNQSSKNSSAKQTDVSAYENYKVDYLELLDYLLANGADPNIRDNAGKTPLMIAIEKKKFIVVKFLLQHHVDIEIQDNSGNTALMLAVLSNHYASVQELLSFHANVDARDSNNCTSLILAVKCQKSLQIIELLIDSGADVTAVDSSGRAAVDYVTLIHIEHSLKQKLLRHMNWWRRKELLLFLYGCDFLTLSTVNSGGNSESNHDDSSHVSINDSDDNSNSTINIMGNSYTNNTTIRNRNNRIGDRSNSVGSNTNSCNTDIGIVNYSNTGSTNSSSQISSNAMTSANRALSILELQMHIIKYV